MKASDSELSAATLAVLGYPPEMRPFRAVQSGKRIELEAWLQLLERPRDMNQELELFGYNAFSLACDLGHLLSKLELGDDASLAEVGKTEDEAALQLRVAILDAEQEDVRMAAVDSLVAHKEHAAVAAVMAEKEAALAEVARLKAELPAR